MLQFTAVMNKTGGSRNPKKKYSKNLPVAVIFGAFIIIFYGATLFNGFVMDDAPEIERNPYVKSLKYLPKVVTSCMWEYANQGCYGRAFYYRPMQYLSYFLAYQISPMPWVFHLIHLIYLFAAVFLVFVLAKTITNNFAFSFTAATIFLIHPVNSMVANWISTDSDVLFTVFTLLAVIFYVKWRNKGLIYNLIPVYLFYFLALLAKETAIILPLLIFLADAILFNAKLKEFLRWHKLKIYLAFAIPALIYLLMRSAVVGSGNYLGNFSLQERIYAALVLFAKYLGKLVYPYPLQAVYDFKLLPHFFSLTFLLSVLAVLIFFSVFVLALKKQKKLLAFSFIWIAVFIAPAVGFLQAAGAGSGVFMERYLFASTIGFAFGMSYILCYTFKIQEILSSKKSGLRVHPLRFLPKKTSRVIFICLASLVIAGAWTIVYINNKAWKDNETLYIKTLAQVPSAHGIRYQLGQLYFERGDLEKAREQFEKIIKTGQDWPDITMAYKGLGDYYRAKGDLRGAIMALQKAVETSYLSPRDYVVFNDLGVAYMKAGNYARGLVSFCQALQLLPENQTTLDNFNAATAAVETGYATGTLYENVSQELIEAPDKFNLLDFQCRDVCRAEFAFKPSAPEIMLAVLISAATASGAEEVKIENPAFDSKRNAISLSFDKKFSGKAIRFIFPTCRGIYYTADLSI